MTGVTSRVENSQLNRRWTRIDAEEMEKGLRHAGVSPPGRNRAPHLEPLLAWSYLRSSASICGFQVQTSRATTPYNFAPDFRNASAGGQPDSALYREYEYSTRTRIDAGLTAMANASEIRWLHGVAHGPGHFIFGLQLSGFTGWRFGDGHGFVSFCSGNGLSASPDFSG
jgi:hypothetical protein